ncbi:MAG: hypothetical protein ACRCYY_15440 [Trueperaceae bacterium]
MDTLLLEQNIVPLNPTAPEWVTLLENIYLPRLQPHPYEQSLFLGQRLLISQLRGPGSFKPLYSFALGHDEISTFNGVGTFNGVDTAEKISS